MIKVFVPIDDAACSVGANEVALEIETQAKARNIEIELIRNGSRGMLWLEPLVEVEIENKRIGYANVDETNVGKLFETNFLTDKSHKSSIGEVDNHEWIKNQNRVTFQRVGIIDPLNIKDFENHGGLTGLKNALKLSSQEIVNEVTESGLRGRGGAGFPAGIKWKTVLNTSSDQKYVCCNADEGDSGTFADRMLMEGDPFTLIEGMTIAAIAVGATKGFIYIRSEYPQAIKTMNKAIIEANKFGLLGKNILGSNKEFQIEVRSGAGSYVCGEETAMLESLEGKRGVVRAKPPLPAIEGLFGKPTIINNVLTLASVPMVLAKGANFYKALGTEKSKGTQVFQLAGNIKHGGIFETSFGISLNELINKFGGGTLTGKKIKAVQVGGPLGAYLAENKFNTAMDYESLALAGGMLGHGGVVVFDETVDMAEQARFAMEFCAEESCGKCTPCRIGSTRGVEVIDKIVKGENKAANVHLLLDLLDVMAEGSLCAMGGLTPLPVRSALENFPEDFSLISAPVTAQ
ncbi:MAG: formate dehydrogenase beta subunit [Candidatus Nanopelagicales bacterium]